MIRRPPRSTLLTHSFPTRRSSDLQVEPWNRAVLSVQSGRFQGLIGVTPNILQRLEQPLQLPEQEQARIRAAYRSEEHTSELQSLMRISYAVFCLKKIQTKYSSAYTVHTKKKINTISTLDK